MSDDSLGMNPSRVHKPASADDEGDGDVSPAATETIGEVIAPPNRSSEIVRP